MLLGVVCVPHAIGVRMLEGLGASFEDHALFVDPAQRSGLGEHADS
jgi:hypothetical protein